MLNNFLKLSIAFLAIFASTAFAAAKLPLHLIKLPLGFHISLYANNVPNARQMALGENGTLFVGTRTGKVYALVPNQDRTHAAQTLVIADNLNMPNGVALHQGDLYVAEVQRVLRFDDIEAKLTNPPKPVVVSAAFPDKTHHGWKYIRFGPEGWLYIPVGAPCNVCLSKDPRFGTIMRMQPDGSQLEIYAKGIRNTVGFDWDPKTQHLWFTDNGRDWLGDNSPPDELNYAPRKGMHFGFPYFYGKAVPDPKFAKSHKPQAFTPPVVELEAHVAPLGMSFYTGKQFPKDYQQQIFIAEHGSWNRSSKIGYRLTLVKRRGNQVISQETFASGWLQGETFWGRPVATLVMPDGSLLVSDDYAGVIYRITYRPR